MSGFSTSHNIKLDPKLLIPGENYTYQVVSINKKGKTTTSAKQTFKTKGFTVTVGVFDKNHKPVKNKEVTLHSDPLTATTDKTGFATFTDVSPGTHTLIYSQGNQEYNSEVVVANNVVTEDGVQTAPTQSLSVVYGFEQKDNWLTNNWLIVVLLVVLVAAFATILMRRNKVASVGASGITDAEISAMVSDDPAPQTSNEPISHVPTPSNPQPGSTFTPDNNQDKKEP